MATSIAPARQPQKAPFRFGTVKHIQPVGTVDFVPGQRIPTLDLPQVGMLHTVYGRISGTITLSAPGAVNPFGYDALVSQLVLKTNQGSSSIAQLSGRGVGIVNRKIAPNALPVQNAFGNAAGANVVDYGFVIPVAANDRQHFDMGLVNLQAPEVRVTLDITPAPIADFVTNVTNTALTLSVWYEYYEIPSDPRFELPALTLVQTIEEPPVPILRTGDNAWQIPRMGTMFDLAIGVVVNGQYAALDTTVDNWRLQYNNKDNQYDIDQPLQKLLEAALYNRPGSAYLKDGIIDINLWHAGANPWNGGDFRDAIDTEENTTTKVIVKINNGVVLTGAQNDYLIPVRRIVQRLV